uniref:DUF4806 domain-containing protein n=1 Tax=Schistosoma mansoni TaxID=6183 RepID=A0AA82N832_SCHMA
MTCFRLVTLLLKAQLQLTEKVIVMRFLQLYYLLQAVPTKGFWKIMVRVSKSRSALKRKESFLCNSVDMDVAEMQTGNTRVQYPRLRMFEKVVSPIANSTQLDSSPSTSEDKNLTAQFERIYTLLLKVSASISELNTNMKLVLSKFTDRQDPRQFDCGLSSQQFPLSSEEELGTLDACLEQKDVRDRFMAMLTRLMDDDPKTSMRYILSYIMKPEVAINFTLLGTSSKRAIQKCRFYGCVRSALTNRFLSSSINEKDLAKLYDMATQSYFHDMRDKVQKRHRRNKEHNSQELFDFP